MSRIVRTLIASTALTLTLFVGSSAGAAFTEQERRAVMSTYHMGMQGVGGCCDGDAQGCLRYHNATEGLSQWCIKGMKEACQLQDLIQQRYIGCVTTR